MERLFSRKLSVVQRVDVGDVRFGRSHQIKNRIILVLFFGAIAFLILLLVSRLFQLTVVKGAYYRRLSEENRIRQIIVEPKRGTIMDRKGIVLVESKMGDINTLAPRIPAPRTYVSGEETGHLIGYRQVASAADIQNDNCLNKLSLGDKVGKKGIEALYDCQLRGVPGRKLTEVDASGTYLRTLSVLPPQNGTDIRLALDYDLQKKAYELIKGKRAVVIGLNPTNGEILVYASSPSFDPQMFEDGNAEAAAYFTDPEKPMFDRIVNGIYPPGSLFKLFIAAGALEDKKMTPDTIIMDEGTLKAGPLSFGNWYYLEYGKTEGPVDMVKAIQRSNDIYFYKAGEALGGEGMKKWSSIFGLGEDTHLGFTETESTIPSPFWKKETLKEQWYLGDTYNMSIGQGYLQITPIEIAQGAEPFANGGYLCQPQFLKNAAPRCKKLPISPETFATIREGMQKACQTGGTGWPLFDFAVDDTVTKMNILATNKTASEGAIPKIRIPVGCKTGTAESEQTAKSMPHAWFTAFAPFDKPEIQLTVLVEQGGQGSDVAAPIARDIFKAYFERSQ